MKEKMIIVRYGEIGLKSPQTRKIMEQALVRNIKTALGNDMVSRERGRIFVESNSTGDAEKISRVFGVVSTSVAIQTTSKLDDIVEAAKTYTKDRISPSMKFAVRARRTGDHDYKSPDLASKIGSIIAGTTGAKVDLDHPDVTIYVEVRDKDAYIFDNITVGFGGMPLGTQGRALALISGGIDSPVAAWLMMKRGVEIIALFMDCRPLVDDRTFNRAEQTIKELTGWTNKPIKTYVVPYGEALLKLLKHRDPKLGCVLCKRMMFLVGERLAKEEKSLALITGESLGQVASQTLQNLRAIESDVALPIFRPLIGMDKTDIVDLAKAIGTYEASIQPANCCLGPPLHPATRATSEQISHAEEIRDMNALVDEAINRAVIIEVGK
jgi:thiamine biosynthesis protein ThiI